MVVLICNVVSIESDNRTIHDIVGVILSKIKYLPDLTCVCSIATNVCFAVIIFFWVFDVDKPCGHRLTNILALCKAKGGVFYLLVWYIFHQ